MQVWHQNTVQDIAFSPDGQYLATASSDHTVRIWRWNMGEFLEEVCSRLPRDLTQEEWQQYLGNEPYRSTCSSLSMLRESSINPPLFSSATPVPTTTPTREPLTTSTLEPIQTPSPSPTIKPTPCSTSPGPTLGKIWESQQLLQSLGCPINNENGITTAYQPFERGFMLWRQDTTQIYMILDNGSWQIFKDTWVEGQPEYSCSDAHTPTSTPPTPRRGFGKVWCVEPGVREGLGNALADENGDYRLLQDFQKGSMVVIPEKGTYLLFADSYTWSH